MSRNTKAWWHTSSAHCYRRLICGWAESWAQFCITLLMQNSSARAWNDFPQGTKQCIISFWNDSSFWILLNMNVAVKEGWLVSSSLHQDQSFAHSSVQTGKWLTCHFSFSDSCWGIIGEEENEQPPTICIVLRLAKKRGGQINGGKAGETASQWKTREELENDHSFSENEE